MGRPREFDVDDVLERACETFWQTGFEGTSIADLGLATGLTTGSIYKAFGSKEALHLRVLDRYLDDGLATIRELLSVDGSTRDRLWNWLHEMAVQASRPTPTRGCFAVVCAAELGPDGSAVRARLKRHDRKLHALVAEVIGEARPGSERRREAHDLAQFLCAAVNGVQVEARKGISRGAAETILRTALDAVC